MEPKRGRNEELRRDRRKVKLGRKNVRKLRKLTLWIEVLVFLMHLNPLLSYSLMICKSFHVLIHVLKQKKREVLTKLEKELN